MNGNLLMEAAYAGIFFVWIVLLVTFITKKTYEWMTKRGAPHNVAIYYNRKLIHAAAGGLVAVFIPFTFSSPLLPFTLALVLAVFTYLPHKTGKLLQWFQDPENIYEVHFCITWGLSVLISWLVFHDMIYAIVPTAFMSFGDGVTGVVRNALYKRRTKAWAGNVAMAAVCIPVGYAIAGIWGALAGLASSIIEHFELKPLDDNITVPLTALLIMILGNFVKV
ncbi:MAG: dolichol kinase [Thermofilaceae archaeon]|nr:dolichol kinase [Thermofilaceae archaeon]MCX8180071.1 dolichol kinase [Thermofilaceae archaeon]MDW8003187.1 dolichol kinase [Thermofilaceae archaeon]